MTSLLPRSLSTWFYLSLLFLILTVISGVSFPLPFVPVVTLWLAGWCFAVWTIGVGVRAGQRV